MDSNQNASTNVRTRWKPARLGTVNRDNEIVVVGPRIFYAVVFTITTKRLWFIPKEEYTWVPCGIPAFPMRLALISPPEEVIATLGFFGYRLRKATWNKEEMEITIYTKTRFAGMPIILQYPNEFLPLTHAKGPNGGE